MTNTNEIKEQQIEQTNWIDEEVKNLGESKTFEKIPSVVFVENKTTKLEIDFSKPFEKWSGANSTNSGDVTKAIIPCIQDGVLKNWWLNVKNPVYGEIIRKAKTGVREFTIIQIGSKQSTQYKIIE